MKSTKLVPNISLKISNAHKQALKIMYSSNPDFEKAKKLLILAAEKNDYIAIYALGTWHFSGVHGFIENKAEAIRLWEIAAAKKVPEALFDLAVSYETGIGIKVNLRKAFSLYVDAALRGDHQAVFAVGRCYFYGIGTSKNKLLADIWFDKAEELGVFEADDLNE